VLFYPPFAPLANSGHADAVPGDLLMVNPVPAKGAALVRELATLLPERDFTLVEGWWNTAAEFTLPNITHVRRTDKMNDLYVSHRLLLVPSVVPDAFPRVIIEAALAALPAAGSDTGGISEAIGETGLLLPRDDASAWAQAITALTTEQASGIGHAARDRAAWFTRPCLPELAAAGIIDQ
jgi:glycosyltransferase involved in cell wall biosynthesis